MSKTNPASRERYAQNAVGDFYVEKDLCLQCMAPEAEAPELMGFDEKSGNCYFKRQPATPEELEHAIAAVSVSDIQALRYGGHNEYVLRRLRKLGASDCCDLLVSEQEMSLESAKQNFLRTCWRKLWKSK
jgi:hypothetical protein